MVVSEDSKEVGKIASSGFGREVVMQNRLGSIIHGNFIWEGGVDRVQRGKDGNGSEGREISSRVGGLVLGAYNLHGHGEDNSLIVPCEGSVGMGVIFA